MNATIVTTAQLQLADRIVSLTTDRAGTQVPDAAMGLITVKQVTDKEVTLFRPYTHTADFSSTGGVICYVGIEEWKVEIRDDVSWQLITRTTLR
jgi:hypothetical protein